MDTGIADGYDYRRALKRIAATGLTVALLGMAAGGALAADGGYGEAKKVGSGDFASSAYNVTVNDTLYQYTTGKDGKAYYATFDGQDWTDWTGWESQPADYQYDPAPVVYNDASYVTYAGQDGKYYFSAEGGEFTDISGDLTFKCAPYANVYDGKLYIYGVAEDGYVYWIDYNGSEWGEWGEIGGQTTSAYEVYAVDWDGYNNVLWTSDDGHAYWNRWDGEKWSGTKELPNGLALKSAPYATGYEADEKLYAYAVSADGKPAWNAFDGEGWGGWKEYDGFEYEVENQPSAYVYEDVQHVVYTGADGHAYYTEFDGKTESEWTDLGANYAWDTYQYEYDGDLYLTYTGENGEIYVKAYAAGGEEEPADERLLAASCKLLNITHTGCATSRAHGGGRGVFSPPAAVSS